MSGGPPVASTSGNGGAVEKDKDSLWYFTSEQLASSPSRRHGIDSDQELSYRQMTAYLIQEMGQRLQVSQLCINTAIVYMHRFYAFHSFTHFHRNGIAAASLFLAAKVEEQPRKLEHVIKAANKCLNQQTSSTTDAYYIEQAQDLVFNENVLLQTLGFDVAIDHPHTHVVKTCHLVKACKDLAQTSYFLASNSLHLTSMCLQYKPTVVACFCIYLACKWSRWEIPQSTEGKHWFHYVDRTVTMDLLKQLTDEFIAIYEKSPARLKSKLNSIKALAQGASNRAVGKDKKAPPDEWKMVDMMKMYHSSINTNDVNCTTSSVAQSISYANQAAAETQAQQSVTPALLPPPPQQQQQQQMRKSELHSSQHRSHHNSSSSNHTSHSKLGFPAAGDVPDHKHSSHKQQPFGGSFVNRVPREHSQTSQMMPTTNQSRSNLSSSSSGRSALPSGLVAGGGQPAPRQATQGHQLDAASYHKSRERGNLPVGALAHGVVPSHTAGHQKLSQKQDSSRVISKDAPGRMPDQAKQGSSSSSKLFASSSSMGGVAPYVGSQQPSGVQSNLKMDPPHDMQRNMIHNQRGGVFGGTSVPSPAVATLGYHQTQPLSRQGSSSSSSGGNNNKHDQNKSLSVHMQQQQQQQHHHKQNVPIDGQFGPGSAAAAHDLQQQHPQHQSHPYPPNMRSSDILHSDDHSQQFSSGHAVLAQQAPPPQAKASMFSPDWSDKLQHPLMASSFNGSLTAAPGSDSYGFKMSSSSSTKDSPKRTERDRSAEAFIKKEKNRNSHTGVPDAAMAMAMPGRSGLQQPQMKSVSGQKKLDLSANLNELAGTSTGASVGVKRPNESVVFKQEDDFLRDTKVRKLDNVSLGLAGYPDSNKLQVVNGIETNPDLVRSLLKESLCPPNALLKTEPLGAPSLQPPAELLEPTAVAVSHKGNTEALGAGAAQSSMSMEVLEGGGGGKAEKKKKKDKHKHKEKDKTKDREERKKHKKDKERHKDRESDTSEPVKLKLSKEKLEAAGVGGASEFKIKIAKERISGDLNSSAGLTQMMSGNDPTGPAAPTPALKIKISKDKLENYSSGSSDTLGLPQASLNAHSSVSGFYSSFGAHNSVAGSTSSHSSSKKKDRDRDKDREREKKRSSQHDFIKATNGSGSGGGGGGVVAPVGAATGSSLPVHMSNASSKSQNSSKIQHLSNNMSQLFGESNDDDDDDDDDDNVYQSYHEYSSKPPKVKRTLSSSLSSASSSTSATTTTSSSQALSRQNADFGSRNTQSQQQLPQHFNQPSSHHQLQQR